MVLLLVLMILCCTRIQASLVCEKCPDPNRFTYPGVGFDLTPNYGTSVVYFPNKTSVAVAKIEGGPAYKNLMSHFTQEAQRRWETPGYDTPPTELADAVKSAPLYQKPSRLLDAAFKLPFLRWVPYPRQSAVVVNPDTIQITGMLSSLKSATEAYLNTSISDVRIALPHHFGESHREVIKSASRAAGLALPEHGSLTILAAQAASEANDICVSTDTMDQYEQFVLVLNYGRTALTMSLLSCEDGVFETLKVIHVPELKVQALLRDACLNRDAEFGSTDTECGPDSPVDHDWCLGFCDQVEDIFHILSRKIGNSYQSSEIPSKAPKVVILGDRFPEMILSVIDIRMERMMDEWRNIAGRESMPYPRWPLNKRREQSGPVYAAALGAAMVAKANNDYPTCIISRHCNDPTKHEEL